MLEGGFLPSVCACWLGWQACAQVRKPAGRCAPLTVQAAASQPNLQAVPACLPPRPPARLPTCPPARHLLLQAPAHALPFTEAAVEQAFGFSVGDLFSEFAGAPVASGSIGQIHRGVLSDTGARLTGMQPGGWGWGWGGGRGWGRAAAVDGEGSHAALCCCCCSCSSPCRFTMQPLLAPPASCPPASCPPASCPPASCPAGTVVAVKVRHPGVSEAIERDFGLMMAAARAAEHLPALRALRLEESLKQFAAPLREQVGGWAGGGMCVCVCAEWIVGNAWDEAATAAAAGCWPLPGCLCSCKFL